MFAFIPILPLVIMAKKKRTRVNKAKSDHSVMKDRLIAWKDRVLYTGLLVPGVSEEIFDQAESIFFPVSMSGEMRRQVHLAAEELGLYHISYGDSSLRYVVVSRTPVESPEGDEHFPLPLPTQKIERAHFFFELSSDEVTFRQSLFTKNFFNGNNSHLDISDNFPYSSYFLSHCERVLSLPSTYTLCNASGLQKSILICVQTVQDLEDMALTLLDTVNHEFALDLELHAERRFYGMSCLLQISCVSNRAVICGQVLESGPNEVDFIVDTLAIPWSEIGRVLYPSFSDPTLTKVCHAAQSMDIPSLFRDFGLVLIHSFDTQLACRALGIMKLGLVSVLKLFDAPIDCEQYADSKDKFSCADWRMRYDVCML